MKRLKIIITGGHHNSGLVVAKSLIRLGHTVVWIGHRQAAKGDTNLSAEFLEVTKEGIPFHDLKAGKLGVSPTLSGFLNLPLGFFRARSLLTRLRPDAVLSFGSYLGLTVALAAFFRKVPLFVHEQTVVAGKANKLAARFARRIYLTWDSSRPFFPPDKTLVVGLPLRSSLLRAKKTRLFKNPLPTVLIMGGKQGSHLINQLIFAHLPELLTDYNLIHQTGTNSVTGDYHRALALSDSLPVKLRSRYRPCGYLGEHELGPILASCDLYLGRSGAHVTYELAILGVRSLLIPFPHTHGQEQLQNARFLAKSGLAQILPQSRLSYPALRSALGNTLSRQVPDPLPLPRDADTKLITDLLHETTL